MTKFITIKILLCFLLMIRVTFLSAGPEEVAAFNTAAGDVLLATQDIIYNIPRVWPVEGWQPRLQGCLEMLLRCWTSLTVEEQNTLEDPVDFISRSIITCFQLIADKEPMSMSVGHPELFSLLLQFIHEDFRDVIYAVDQCIRDGVVSDSRDMLLFVKRSIKLRTDISNAEKKIVMNLVQNCMSQLNAVHELPRSLLFDQAMSGDGGTSSDEEMPVAMGAIGGRRGRRYALAPGAGASCVDAIAALRLDSGGWGDVDSLPRDHRELLIYIEEHFLTAESLMRMKEDAGGAGSSRDEPIDILPLLNDLERVLARADLLLRQTDGQLDLFKLRLRNLFSRCRR